MQTYDARPSDDILELAENSGIQNARYVFWHFIDPESEYPKALICECGFRPAFVPRGGPYPVGQAHSVSLKAHATPFRSTFFFGQCAECSEAYWTRLEWCGNFPDPALAETRQQLATW